MTNSADPEETNWSGSTLFAKEGFQVQQDQG